MRYAIITVEVADPDFGIARMFTLKSFAANPDFNMQALADVFGPSRWPDNIMRVHRYNCNLPALVPSHANRPWPDMSNVALLKAIALLV